MASPHSFAPPPGFGTSPRTSMASPPAGGTSNMAGREGLLQQLPFSIHSPASPLDPLGGGNADDGPMQPDRCVLAPAHPVKCPKHLSTSLKSRATPLLRSCPQQACQLLCCALAQNGFAFLLSIDIHSFNTAQHAHPRPSDCGPSLRLSATFPRRSTHCCKRFHPPRCRHQSAK
jgi:hypothetical protein